MSPEPDVYTHGHSDAVLRSHRWRTAENSAAYLLPRLSPGQRVLDVGSGPGTLTVDLARRVAPGEVVGVDVSAKVTAEARRHAADSRLDNVSFVAGDFRTVGFDHGSFDVAHAHQVLQHVSDPVGALAAMAALAEPGDGLVAARDSDYSAFVWSPADDVLDRWRELYLAVARCNRAEPDAGRWLLRWARQAGLRDVEYTTSTWTFSSDDVHWWSDLWAERTLTSSFAAQAVEYGLATRAELEDVAAGWRAWATRPDPVFVVVHGQVLARPPA